MRRVNEEGRAARENMQRILDEIDARRHERQQRAARRGLWSRIAGSHPD
jgi:hypothetical protein